MGNHEPGPRPDIQPRPMHDVDETQHPKTNVDIVWASPDCRVCSMARSIAEIPHAEARNASNKEHDKLEYRASIFVVPAAL